MLSVAALIPSAPVLVPELAGRASAELTDLRAAVFAAAHELPDRWIAVGVGARDDVVRDATGTFGGYGADVRVALSPGANPELGRLPLCALMTGWVRQQVRPAARAEVTVLSTGCSESDAVTRGRALRAAVDATPDAVGLLLVADGAHTLTPPAPGGFDPDSVGRQQALDDALAAGATAAVAELSAGAVGRVAYQALVGLFERSPASARELYRGAPYGVGYFVGVWTP